MSQEYAMSRVRDALEKSGGNHLKAQRLVLGWIEKDHSLLFGLVGPHLQSIISHAVNHAAAAGKPAPAPEPAPVAEQGGTGELGAALLRNLTGTQDANKFGEAATHPVSKPAKASQAHVDTMHQIAKKP